MRLHKFRIWVHKNEKYLSLVFFLGGFLVDNFTLTRIDLLFDNMVLLIYLLTATTTIVLINLLQAGKMPYLKKKFPAIVDTLSLITQFTFGGLFSGYVIFYTKSASWASSWLFLLIIYGFFIGNEKFRKYYEKIDFQINILFISLFSFLIFFLPVVLKKIETYIFVLAGLVSLTFIYFFCRSLFVFISRVSHKRKRNIVWHILGIYVVFNLLYFLNIIPPVPLSIKELRIYKNIARDNSGDYLLEEYDFPWYKFDRYFLEVDNGIVYIYSSVFAPTDLNTNIINVWQKYNEVDGKWTEVDKIAYQIKGGKDTGYRGYSFITNATPGKWRVDITNIKGQVLGRIKFTVK